MANKLQASSGASSRQNIKGYAFISPWILGFIAFLLLPIAMSIYYSFCDFNPLVKSGPLFIGTANFQDLAHDPIFWKALRNTFWYAAIAVPSSLVVSLGLALLLNMRIPGQPVFRTIIFLPSLVPTIASAMLWLWIYNSRYGLLDAMLDRIGITGPGWLTTTEWAMPSLMFMSLWGVGYTVVIFIAGLQDVPRELYESAEIDGASSIRRLWHVTLPLLSPVIFFNLIMAIIGTFQVFATPYAMTQGGPDRATYFYTYYIFDNAFTNNKMGYACALGLIQLVIILALTGIATWSSKRWVHYQGR